MLKSYQIFAFSKISASILCGKMIAENEENTLVSKSNKITLQVETFPCLKISCWTGCVDKPRFDRAIKCKTPRPAVRQDIYRKFPQKLLTYSPDKLTSVCQINHISWISLFIHASSP